MRTSIVAVLLCLAACAHSTPGAATSSTPSYQAIVDAPDRTEADRALDPGRHPADFLAFVAPKPGMKVGELFAGGGYTTELLARAVAPGGVVYGENPKWALEKFAEKPWSERLTREAVKNVVRADRELDDPMPPEATGLDVVVSNANYHDAVWSKVDRPKMNQAVFASLRSGGAYVICDSSAKAGAGINDVQTLHRIEEQVVRDEVAAAGFKLESSGDFLRNPQDTRDWNSSPVTAAERRGTSDRFCLRFVKP
jgi:predicted methyltransferase